MNVWRCLFSSHLVRVLFLCVHLNSKAFHLFAFCVWPWHLFNCVYWWMQLEVVTSPVSMIVSFCHWFIFNRFVLLLDCCLLTRILYPCPFVPPFFLRPSVRDKAIASWSCVVVPGTDYNACTLSERLFQNFVTVRGYVTMIILELIFAVW